MSPSENAHISPRDLVAACRRLFSAIDKLDAEAASRVGVARNDLRCRNLLETGRVGQVFLVPNRNEEVRVN